MLVQKRIVEMSLSSVKVIELGALIDGTYASTLSGKFSTDVVKIELQKVGNSLRKWRKLHDGTSLCWYARIRNNNYVTHDLKSSKAQKIVCELVTETNIVIDKFRPKTRWKKRNTRLANAVEALSGTINCVNASLSGNLGYHFSPKINKNMRTENSMNIYYSIGSKMVWDRRYPVLKQVQSLGKSL